MSSTHDHCDGAACQDTAAVAETVSLAPQDGQAFRIHGMDCAEEVAILKRALADHVPEDALHFDVLSGRMTVPEGVTAQLVIDAVGAKDYPVIMAVAMLSGTAVIVGNLVQGNRLAAAYGRDIGGLEEDDGVGRRYQVRFLFGFNA